VAAELPVRLAKLDGRMTLVVNHSAADKPSVPRHRRPGRTEGKLQELARRQAARQLLMVSPNQFSQAREQYLRWEAFSLWVRAVVEAEGRVPALVNRALQQRCPAFLEHERRCREVHPRQAAPLPLLLLEWIHDRMFIQAEREGWLDALIFFSVRHPYSVRIWAYWEQCEKEWRRKHLSRYPTFDEWRLAAENWED